MGNRARSQLSPKDIICSDEKQHKIKQQILLHSSPLLKEVLKPKVYITESSSFKSLVQELTGNTNHKIGSKSSGSSSSSNSASSPSSSSTESVLRIIETAAVIVEDTFVPVMNTALQQDNNDSLNYLEYQLSYDNLILFDQCNNYSSEHHHHICEDQSCFVTEDENNQQGAARAAMMEEADVHQQAALLMDDELIIIPPVEELYTTNTGHQDDQSLMLQDYYYSLKNANEEFKGGACWEETWLGETAVLSDVGSSKLGGSRCNNNNPDVESWLLDDNTDEPIFPNLHYCSYRAQNDSVQGGLCI